MRTHIGCIDGQVAEATLLDNATARDLVSLLPITLTLEEYNATEKIGYRRGSCQALNVPGSLQLKSRRGGSEGPAW